MVTPLSLLPKVRSKALRAAAEGQPCALRVGSLIGLPCDPPSTTVLCHLPDGSGGMATKSSDLSAAFGCATCHDLIDGRHHGSAILHEKYPAAVMWRLLAGMAETQARWVEAGLISVKGDENAD